ncbi:MAG: FecR domain-containing protein [Dysgonomonas sp.]|nr:FecR domain-containing protein [Dysgonomonas sp.]
MREQDFNKDYSKYTFSDFLLDDFFISSISEPSVESVDFWKRMLESNKVNLEEFYLAKDFIESLDKHNNELVSDTELSNLWNDINATIKPKRNIVRKALYIGSCVAAGIIIFVLVLPRFSKKNQQKHDDIVLFAQENQTQNTNKDIQIVLSDQKTINLDEDETDIVYDSTEIKFSNKEISKKESAAYNQLLVPKGKRSRLTLSDGTKLYVNAGTRVIYPIEFTENKREIYVDGEVFIDVFKDTKRPFIVKTSEIEVKVLGTQFNVMAYETDINKQIVLAKGSIKVSKKNSAKEILLKPAEKYEYNNGTEQIERVNISYYTSWIDGMYIFESQRLDAVLLRLSRYYGVEITSSKDVADLKCSGKMDLKDNLEDVLKGLSFSFPIKVQKENDKYNIEKIN